MGPVNDCSHLLFIHLNGPGRDNKPQEGNRAAVELTFLCLNIELILQEALENLADMTNMVSRGARKNLNVIYIDKNKLI